MGKGRMEAFSDGVIAIIITIMVLELKVPHGESLEDLKPMIPILLSYILGFVNVGLYWNNHHHMLQTAKIINGRVLWANLHLLFWLSLIPVAMAWMGESHFEKYPNLVYGIIMFMAGVAYVILQQELINVNGKDSLLAKAVKNDVKGKLSAGLYLVGIGLIFVNHWISLAIYIGIAGMWFIPDKRIEKTMLATENKENEKVDD
jgi:uncharacterized membrane protein